jgi:hypothetical protein
LASREPRGLYDTAERTRGVIGLRHEPVACGATGTYPQDDGWYRLLYLVVVDGDHQVGV